MKRNKLPKIFKPILWSYNFNRFDPQKNSKIVIVNAINYGDLRHWRWIIKQYGKDAIRETLRKISAWEIKPRTRRLAGLIFGIKNFNYAPRGASA